MKTRQGFVSNSSSTSFIITNNSSTVKTLVDFAKENLSELHNFNKDYDYNCSEEELIASAEENNIIFMPYESKECVFGDEDGTLIGSIYDYALRDGGISKNFSWSLKEYLR